MKYEVGPFVLSEDQHSLYCNEVDVPLPPRLFNLLLLLVEHEGRTVSQQVLRERVWPDSFVEDAAVSKNVSLLRAALRPYVGDAETIRTLPKRGYQLVLPVEPLEERKQFPEPALTPTGPAALGQLETLEPHTDSAEKQRAPFALLPRVLFGSASVLLVVAVALVGWKLVEWARRPWFLKSSLVAAPVTPGVESEFDPAISPDSHRLAYISRKPGTVHYAIFIRPMGPTGEPPRVLETGSGDALHPAWSPDGRTLAFLHCGNVHCAFQMVDASGSNLQTLRELPRFNVVTDQLFYEYRQMWPAWMPDGKAVIFPFRGPDDESERLVVHTVASGQETKLTGGDQWEEDGSPTVAPDGHTLAFRRMHLTYCDLWTVDLLTHQQKQITAPLGTYWSGLTWARDGSGLLTAKKESDDTWHVWWLPLKGVPRKLDVAQAMPLTPVLAPDNKALLIVAADRTSNLTLLDTSQSGSVPPLNGAATQGDLCVEFSPDEKRAAILSKGTGTREVWMAEVSGPTLVNRRQLTHGLGDMPTSLAWSPDGSLIVVGFSRSPGVLKVVDVATGSIEAIRVPGLENSVIISPTFSPDGKFVFAATIGAINSGVFRIGIGPVPHADFVIDGHPYDIAFDGANTLYLDVRNASGIERVDLRQWDMKAPLARESSKRVPQLSEVLAPKSWTIRRGSLYYLDLHDDERRLRRLNLTTGEASSVTGSLPRIAFFNGAMAYAPDRKLLIYSQLESQSSAQIMSLSN